MLLTEELEGPAGEDLNGPELICYSIRMSGSRVVLSLLVPFLTSRSFIFSLIYLLLRLLSRLFLVHLQENDTS